MKNAHSHYEQIVDQFSKQSVPFTKIQGHLDAIQTLISMSGVQATDRVLDVACGPGIVACEFAKVAQQVTGIDVTPAMINVAENRQRELGLVNLFWKQGDALGLPFADDHIDAVIARYSFHHLLAPAVALKEMIRVCKPGGRVLVADVAMPEEKSAHYDQLELLRDPSHTHALTESEFDNLYSQAGLINSRYTSYSVELELEAQLKASFPNPGDGDRVRSMVIKDIGVNQLGIKAQRIGNEIKYSVPIRVYVGQKLS